jgi:DNA repair exonuclease SbcCD ATPase subunit
MPRDNSESNEESGSGMKVLAAFLAVGLGAIGFFFYKSKEAAVQQANADAKTIATLSNQVSEVRTRLAMETGMQGIAQSNLQYAVSRRTGELSVVSNRHFQTTLLLSNAQHEAHAAQSQLPTKAANIASLEAHRDQLIRDLEVIPALQREIAELRRRLQEITFAQAATQETISRLRTEKANLERLLDDLSFLRLQASRSEDAAELRQRAASKQPIRAGDSRVRLELQPDGSVRPSPIEGTVK